MCTLIVLDRVVPGRPLVVAANRDEYLSRPAAPPSRFPGAEQRRPAYVAPADLEAGGTWLGINEEGLFVGLTNRPTQQPKKGKRSRGLLVLDALGRPDAGSLADALETEIADSMYSPFHLFYADGRRSFLTVLRDPARSDEAPGRTTELPPGVHVVGNRDADDPESDKVVRIRERARALDPAQPFQRLVSGLIDLLGSHDHAGRPHENPCVHSPGYGTRSSAILSTGNRWHLWFADGAPCQTKFANYSRLLDELRDERPLEEPKN